MPNLVWMDPRFFWIYSSLKPHDFGNPEGTNSINKGVGMISSKAGILLSIPKGIKVTFILSHQIAIIKSAIVGLAPNLPRLSLSMGFLNHNKTKTCWATMWTDKETKEVMLPASRRLNYLRWTGEVSNKKLGAQISFSFQLEVEFLQLPVGS